MEKSTRRSVIQVMTSSAWLQSERDKESADTQKQFTIVAKPKSQGAKRPFITRFAPSASKPSSPSSLKKNVETISKARVRWASFLQAKRKITSRPPSALSPGSRDSSSPSSFSTQSKATASQSPQPHSRSERAQSHLADSDLSLRFRFPNVSGKLNRRKRTGTELGTFSPPYQPDSALRSSLPQSPANVHSPPSPLYSSGSASFSPSTKPPNAKASTLITPPKIPRMPKLPSRVSSNLSSHFRTLGKGVSGEESPNSDTPRSGAKEKEEAEKEGEKEKDEIEKEKDEVEKEVAAIARRVGQDGGTGLAGTADITSPTVGNDIEKYGTKVEKKEAPFTAQKKRSSIKEKERRKRRESQTGSQTDTKKVTKFIAEGTDDGKDSIEIDEMDMIRTKKKKSRDSSMLIGEDTFKESEKESPADSHRKKRRSRRESQEAAAPTDDSDRKLHKTKSIQIAHDPEFRVDPAHRAPVSAQRPTTQDLLPLHTLQLPNLPDDVSKSGEATIESPSANRRRQRRSVSTKAHGSVNFTDDEMILTLMDVAGDTPTPPTSSGSSAQNSYRSPLLFDAPLLSQDALSPILDLSPYPLHFPSSDVSYSGSSAASPAFISPPPYFSCVGAPSSPSSSVTVIPIFSPKNRNLASSSLSSSSSQLPAHPTLSDVSLSLSELRGSGFPTWDSPPSSPVLSPNHDSLLHRVRGMVHTEAAYIESLNRYIEVNDRLPLSKFKTFFSNVFCSNFS